MAINSWVPIVTLICLPLLGLMVASIASALVSHKTIILVNQDRQAPYIHAEPEKVNRKELN